MTMIDYERILISLDKEGCRRKLFASVPQDIVDLSSNDYLGLARREEYVNEFLDTTRTHLFTSSASRLLASNQSSYIELEDYLSEIYGKSALIFNSGYHVNTGCVSSIAKTDTLIVCDKLVHASIIDGIILSKAPFYRFRHNDVESLKSILQKEHSKYKQIIVIIESVYSMDGDIAPLREIVTLKKSYSNIFLYVDEAHAVGVFGKNGLGIVYDYGLLADVDVLVGTFGKACASYGAFALTSEEIKDYFVNTARSFIFSTSLPPISVAWTLFVFKKMMSMHSERRNLHIIAEKFRNGLISITGNQNISDSQIVPWIIGDTYKTMSISNALKAEGFLALPIRRPTVPPGTERIRFSLNASLSEMTINNLLSAISRLI